jgi:hypothetical protein
VFSSGWNSTVISLIGSVANPGSLPGPPPASISSGLLQKVFLKFQVICLFGHPLKIREPVQGIRRPFLWRTTLMSLGPISCQLLIATMLNDQVRQPL